MWAWGWTDELSEAAPTLEPGQVEAHMVIRQSLSGEYGETHLIAAAGRLWVLSRASLLAPFVHVALEPGRVGVDGEGLDRWLWFKPQGQEVVRFLLMVAQHQEASALVACCQDDAWAQVMSASEEVVQLALDALAEPAQAEPSAEPWRRLAYMCDAAVASGSPLCALVFVEDGVVLSAASDGVVVAWSIARAMHEWSATLGAAPALSVDGKLLAVTSDDGEEVQLWELEAERQRGRFTTTAQPVRLVLGAHGGVMVVVAEGIELWSVAPIKRTGRWRLRGGALVGGALSADGERALVYDHEQVWLMHGRTAKLLAQSTLDGVCAAVFAPREGHAMAAVSEGGELVFWGADASMEAPTWRRNVDGEHGRPCSLAMDDEALWVGTTAGWVCGFSLASGALLGQQRALAVAVEAMALDVETGRLAVAGREVVAVYGRVAGDGR